MLSAIVQPPFAAPTERPSATLPRGCSASAPRIVVNGTAISTTRSDAICKTASSHLHSATRRPGDRNFAGAIGLRASCIAPRSDLRRLLQLHGYPTICGTALHGGGGKKSIDRRTLRMKFSFAFSLPAPRSPGSRVRRPALLLKQRHRRPLIGAAPWAWGGRQDGCMLFQFASAQKRSAFLSFSSSLSSPPVASAKRFRGSMSARPSGLRCMLRAHEHTPGRHGRQGWRRRVPRRLRRTIR